jgi:PTS system nitrogen regulatory IIA component
MNITEFIVPERVSYCPQIASKKRLLEHISELLAKDAPRHTWNEIFNSLINREKLGSTGLGKGVALPHGRIGSLDKPLCAFVRLGQPVEFDAADGEPVDLVFALLVPEESTEEHLQVLSSIAELFSKPTFCTRMRRCESDACLYRLLDLQEHEQISA